MLYEKCVAVLRSKAIAFDDGDFEIRDNSDGAGAFIARWDQAKLGPVPSKTELDAQSDAAGAIRDEALEKDADVSAAISDLRSKRALTDEQRDLLLGRLFGV